MNALRRWSVGIALFCAMILDGSLAWAFQKILFHPDFGAACWFTVVGITLMALYNDLNKNNIWLALGIGVLADMFYFGYLGVYTVAFPLLCYILQKVARFLPETFWFRLIVCLISYLFVSFYVFTMYIIVGTQQPSFSSFLLNIVPSWIVCTLIYFVSYSFWINLVDKHPFLEHQRNYFL